MEATRTKPIGQWTRKEFEALPERKWSENIGEFDCLIILPTKRIHDSGFRCMDFIAVIKSVPTYRLSGWSDIIHIDGIGGYGYKWFENYRGIPDMIRAVGWSIDCLKTSGLLRMFANNKLVAGDALSSFEIYSPIKK